MIWCILTAIQNSVKIFHGLFQRQDSNIVWQQNIILESSMKNVPTYLMKIRLNLSKL